MARAKARYILDSSIWISLERGIAPIAERAAKLVLNNRVCVVDLIKAELLRGVRNEADYEGLKYRLDSFDCLTADWLEVARFGLEAARRGFNPPLPDLYIAQCSLEEKKVLITQDRHFADLARVRRFRYELW